MSSDAITIIKGPETSKVEHQGGALANLASCFVVDDEESHAEAQILLQDIKALRTKLSKEIFEEPRKLAHRTWKSFVAAEKKLTDPLDDARKTLIKSMTQYEAEELRRAKEEAREQEAILAEQRREDAEVEAEAAVQLGDEVGAKEILDSVEHAPAPVVPPQPRVSRVAGVSTMTTWSAEVDDFEKLVKYVAANPQWIGLLTADMPQLNALARAQRKALALPGVRAVGTPTKSVRA